MIAVKIKAILS